MVPAGQRTLANCDGQLRFGDCSIARRWLRKPWCALVESDEVRRKARVPQQTNLLRELRKSDSIVVDHQVSTRAPLRPSRPAGPPHRARSARPSRIASSTRSIWVLSVQSTTQIRSTSCGQRPDSTSSGTSKTARGAIVRCACRCVSAAIRGCKMPSSRLRAETSENTIARICERSRAPSLAMTPEPKAAAMDSMAAPLEPVSSRAIRSVSMTAAPSSKRSLATVLFPLPIPPVKPIRMAPAPTGSLSGPAKPIQHPTLAGEHHDERCPRKERPERYVASFAQRRAHLHGDPDNRADQGSSEDDR